MDYNKIPKEQRVAVKDAPKREIKQVTKGPVRVKKPSIVKKIFSSFVDQPVDDIGEYLLYDLFIPNIKEFLSDSFDTILFGEKRIRKSSSKYGGHTSYSAYYESMNGKKSNRKKSSERTSSRRLGRREIQEVIYDSREEAVDVLSSLKDLIIDCQMASVADYYGLSGAKVGTYTDNNYGWLELDESMDVRRVRDGYIIELPQPVLLDS